MMYILMKSGSRAGRVVPTNITAARAMLADGRAALPDAVEVSAPAQGFAAGGVVTSSAEFMVGDRVCGTVLPTPVANQLRKTALGRGRRK